MQRFFRVLVIGGVVATATITAMPASAAGTWTKISTPKGPGQPIYRLDSLSTATFTVSGSTSGDLTPGTDTINIYCFSGNNTAADGPLNSSALAITASHTFSGTISISWQPGCILRAIPSTYTGISGGVNDGYVGAFAGPSYYGGLFETTTPTVYGAEVEVAEQRAAVEASSPDVEGLIFNVPFEDFTKSSGVLSNEIYLALLPSNFPVNGGAATAAGIVVDGHNAYPPFTAKDLAVDPATVPVDTFSKSRHSDGTFTMTEKLPLSWCLGNPTPPVSAGTCTIEPTGVTMTRSYVSSAQGALVTVHDRFVSANGAKHTVKTSYVGTLNSQTAGEAGFMLPGHSSFTPITAGTSFTNLPIGPHTIFMTSDIHAADNAPDRTDSGLTYSGRPRLDFFQSNAYAMRYTRTVPAHGAAAMSFAVETGFSMTTVRSLATSAQKALTPHLSLTAPAKTTTDNTPTIKGKVTNATNGLPSKVTITIGTKSKTVNVNQATGAFAVTWTTLANGKHTAKAKATDPSGLVLRASRTFTCT